MFLANKWMRKKIPSCGNVIYNLRKNQMSTFDGGFRRVKYKVACDEDLRFRRTRIKTNKFQPSELTLSTHPQNAALSLLTVTLGKTETDAEHNRTATGHSASTVTFKNLMTLSKLLSYRNNLLRK